MADHPEHLADLFAKSNAEFSALAVPDKAAESLHSTVGDLDDALPEACEIGDLLCALYEALDLPLADIVRSAWGSLVELQEYRDPEKHPPDETSRVRFGKHKITSGHRPRLTILVNDKEVGEIVFDVEVTLHITGTTLSIRDGRIWKATGSEFQGECTLSLSGIRLAHKTIDLFTIPGVFDPEDGMPIPPLSRSRTRRGKPPGAEARTPTRSDASPADA